MILGRTPNGAIKIKSDGGLRAVNCACCGVGCGELPVSGALRSTIESATQVTISASYFYSEPFFLVAPWDGSSFLYDNQTPPEPQGIVLITYSDGILFAFHEEAGGGQSVFFLTLPLIPEDCSQGGGPPGLATIKLNGTDFRASYTFEAEPPDLFLEITFS